LASATLSFPPLDPSSFQPSGTTHTSFLPVEDIHTLLPLTLPKSSPDVTVNEEDSVAIDCVCALLDSDFSGSRALWIHLLLSLVTDARNGLLISIWDLSLQRFYDLSPSKTLQLTALKQALESLNTFFADTQDDPEDWITCMGCVTSFQLPVSKDDWDTYLSDCSGDITATRTRIVNEAIEATHPLVDVWVSGECISAQDTAINRLTSDHAPDISILISDPCLIEWSYHLLKAMKLHFTKSLVTKASHTLPTHLSDLLDAEHQTKVDAACHDARAEAKHLFHAELTRLQSSALEEAARDFETWKSTTLIPEWQAKEASAKAEKLLELDAFKYCIAIEMEDHKENARLVTAKSIVHTKSDQWSCCQECHADPIRANCSVSHMRSPSPSPSQKLDKTPTKVDFQVSQVTPAPLCAPISNHARGRAGPSVAQEAPTSVPPTPIVVPLAGPDNAKASVGTLGDAASGLPSTLTSCLPEALPSTAPLDTVSTNTLVDVVMAPAAPFGDASPSSVRLVSGPDVTPAVPDSSLQAPLVACYQSATPSPTPPQTVAETMEERLVHLLGLTITATLVPIKSSVKDIGTRLRAVEDANAVWGADNDASLGFGRYDRGYGYNALTIPAVAGGEERVDYHIESAPSHATVEDIEMAAVRARYESHNKNKDPHPFFETAIMTACNQACHKMEPAHLSTLASLAAEDWEDFCTKLFIDQLRLPPITVVAEAFITCTRVNLIQAQMESDLTCSLRADHGLVVSPDGPSFTGPHLSAARDDPVALPRPSQLSEPISISSNGSKISSFTESSPPPRARLVGSALDLDTPPPSDGIGWLVMGGKRGRTFASIATSCPSAPPIAPAPTPLPPSAAQAAHSFLTKPQLDSLTRAQVVSAYNAHFSPKLPARVSKDTAIASFLDKASRPIIVANPSAPKPITKTEYTLVYDS